MCEKCLKKNSERALKKITRSKILRNEGFGSRFLRVTRTHRVVNFAHSVQSLVNSVLLRAKIVLYSLLLMTETELLVTSPFHLSSHARLLSLSPPLSLSVPPRLS